MWELGQILGSCKLTFQILAKFDNLYQNINQLLFYRRDYLKNWKKFILKETMLFKMQLKTYAITF